MKKTLALIVAVGLMAGTTNAHCGACGTSHKAEKTTATSASAESKDVGSIVETAQAAGTFKTLLAAVEAAGLSGALAGDGPLTVFAPTDDAFAALPKGTVEALLKDKEKLTAILTYHVLEGAVKAETVVGIDKAQTLNGQSVKVAVVDGRVMIDNAEVIMTDIVCSNGVIHVIDAVILPNFEKTEG